LSTMVWTARSFLTLATCRRNIGLVNPAVSPLTWAFGGGDGIRTHGPSIANVQVTAFQPGSFWGSPWPGLFDSLSSPHHAGGGSGNYFIADLPRIGPSPDDLLGRHRLAGEHSFEEGDPGGGDAPTIGIYQLPRVAVAKVGPAEDFGDLAAGGDGHPPTDRFFQQPCLGVLAGPFADERRDELRGAVVEGELVGPPDSPVGTTHPLDQAVPLARLDGPEVDLPLGGGKQPSEVGPRVRAPAEN